MRAKEHKGTNHMQSEAGNLNFFQYYCVDVAAVISVIITMLLTTLFHTIHSRTVEKTTQVYSPSQ